MAVIIKYLLLECKPGAGLIENKKGQISKSRFVPSGWVTRIRT